MMYYNSMSKMDKTHLTLWKEYKTLIPDQLSTETSCVSSSPSDIIVTTSSDASHCSSDFRFSSGFLEGSTTMVSLLVLHPMLYTSDCLESCKVQFHRRAVAPRYGDWWVNLYLNTLGYCCGSTAKVSITTY